MADETGLPLVHLVRDYFRNEFNIIYPLSSDIFEENKFSLFAWYIMGKFLQEKIDDHDSYISALIDEAIANNALSNIIRLGYDQANTFG